MILEEAWAAGRGVRILCTQPRRISAISVAERIAQERGEIIGENVGYTIRLDSKWAAVAQLLIRIFHTDCHISAGFGMHASSCH